MCFHVLAYTSKVHALQILLLKISFAEILQNYSFLYKLTCYAMLCYDLCCYAPVVDW